MLPHTRNQQKIKEKEKVEFFSEEERFILDRDGSLLDYIKIKELLANFSSFEEFITHIDNANDLNDLEKIVQNDNVKQLSMSDITHTERG